MDLQSGGCRFESRRGYFTLRSTQPSIPPIHDSDQPDGRLNLTASAFNQMGQ